MFKDEIARRLTGLGLSPAREWAIVEELGQHLEDRSRELQGAGASADEARRLALEELEGDGVLARELRLVERPYSEPAIPGAAGSGGGIVRRLVDEARADIRYGVRQLRSTPAFTLMAVLTLAIGIGANMAVFSQVNALLLKRLAVDRPEELKQLEWRSAKRAFARPFGSDLYRTPDTSEYFSYPAYRYLRDHAKSFSDLLCFRMGSVNVTLAGSAESVPVQIVSGNYFRTLATGAALGRVIAPDDDRPDAEAAVAVASHGFFQRALGGDPAAIGRTIRVNGQPFVIVGVTAPGFVGVDPRYAPDLTLPLAPHAAATAIVGMPLARPDVLVNERDWTACQVVGRLRPGVTAEQARFEGEALLHEVIRTNPPAEAYEPPTLLLFDVEHGRDVLRRQTSQSLFILMSVVGVIVLIACANIASLLLARATARRHEIGTRLALGASRGRLVRQLLTESLLLAGLGGGLGAALAYTLGRFLPSPLTTPLSAARPAPLGLDLAPDMRVLAFACGLAVVAGFMFGLAPARRATSVDPLATMKAASSGGGASHLRTGKMLITVQVALSLALLIGASLFIRTLVNLRSAPLGFDPGGVLVVQVNPSLSGYRDERLLNFFEDALDRFRGMPGVIAASMSAPGLVSGAFSGLWICVPDRQQHEADTAWLHRTAPGLFDTMRIPVRLGRDFDRGDREQTQKVAIVNEAFAQKYYGAANPIGHTFGFGRQDCDPHQRTIVGLAAGTRYWTLRTPMSPVVYLPYRQVEDLNGRAMTVALRTRGDPTALVPAVREAMRDLDPDVPLAQVRTQVEQIDRGVQQERLLTNLLVLFGVIAWALASIGIYGTLSYAVTRRTAEIGLRMALGAARRDVLRLVARETLAPVGVGIALGLAVALTVTRWIESFLFGVSKHDPWTMVLASILLLATAALAASLPALRASRIDPLQALRYE